MHKEMTEEALKDRLAKFSVEPALKIHFPLQFTESRLTKLIHILVAHFSSIPKSVVFLRQKSFSLYLTLCFLFNLKTAAKLNIFLMKKLLTACIVNINSYQRHLDFMSQLCDPES